MITENGRRLFHEIAKKQEHNIIPPFWRDSNDINDIVDVCSRLHRAAITYSSIQEKWCSDYMSDRARIELERRERLIERNIRRLTGELNLGCSHCLSYCKTCSGDVCSDCECNHDNWGA